MKKKTIQTLFVLLFIIGIVVGYLLPGDFRSLTRKPLNPAVFDFPKKFGQLDKEGPYFKYTLLVETETASIQLLRIDDAVPERINTKSNQFVYVFKGRIKETIGNTTNEAWPGQLIAIPAGTSHSLERIGDTPVEMIVFSTPIAEKDDTVWLEQ